MEYAPRSRDQQTKTNLLKMKLILLITLTFLSSALVHTSESSREDIKILNRLHNKLDIELRAEGWSLRMEGGQFQVLIRYIERGYARTCAPLNLQASEDLAIIFFDNLFEVYNDYRPLRPYLLNFPISSNNSLFFIEFYNKNGKIHEYPDISNVVCTKGSLYFNSWNHSTKELIEIKTESYERISRIHKHIQK